jgi:hypothetical protein
MIKKITIAAISAFFVASAVLADSTNIGIRISAANLAASGSETTDSGSINSGGAAVTQKEKDANFELPSIFVERQMELSGGLNIALGLDFVPLTESVATLGGGTGTDAKVKAGNLMTAYIQPSFSISDDISFFGKIGYASGDLEINDITRQAGSAGQTGDTQSTDKSADKTLEGPVYGVGIQMNKDIGIFSFVRLEATRTDFDEIKHTNSNGKVLKADAEMDLISLTIGKSF